MIPCTEFIPAYSELFAYLGDNYGQAVVEDYLRTYTERVYGQVLVNIGKKGMSALKDKIEDTYQKEKTFDALTTELTDNTLRVTVAYCPAVRHL